jgi:endonuclease/exonuclease/phosphatase (EEP) superfamily protein YafD
MFRSHTNPDARRGVVVWSKWPMTSTEFGSLNLYQSVTATVALPEGDATVIAVHTSSPTDEEGINAWHRGLDTLSEYRIEGPTIMAGDFNATEDHAPFRRLLDQGWTDTHDNKGCGLDQTWPTDTLPFPVMRLDHVLVSDDFDVLSTEVTTITGSDHLSVVSKIKPAAK